MLATTAALQDTSSRDIRSVSCRQVRSHFPTTYLSLYGLLDIAKACSLYAYGRLGTAFVSSLNRTHPSRSQMCHGARDITSPAFGFRWVNWESELLHVCTLNIVRFDSLSLTCASYHEVIISYGDLHACVSNACLSGITACPFTSLAEPTTLSIFNNRT